MMPIWEQDLARRGAGRRRPGGERGTLARRASIRRRGAIAAAVGPDRRVVPHYPGWAVISPSGEVLSLHGERRLALAALEREWPA
jgi:hypothetical protein